MPFTKFTNLDFDQIKTQLKDYLRANSTFTDFDFEGSNFSVLLNTLAYNTYINSFNANMVVNESFLDSATLRENVVSLARGIGYVPRSRTCSRASIRLDVECSASLATLTLEARGPVCVGATDDSSYIFSIPESITTAVVDGKASFGTLEDPVLIYQGALLKKKFTVDGSLDQRFLLDNPFIDIQTIVVKVKFDGESGTGREYSLVDNIIGVDSDSEIYLIQEVQDEKYELLFGDGIFGKKLENGTEITVSYIVTDGELGNGAENFSFAGTFINSLNNPVTVQSVDLTTVTKSTSGTDIEPIESVKYFAPRLYAAQFRAVTARDYEAIIQNIYPNTESISVVGGEELDPPEFGTVRISIKPKNGDFVSDFDKDFILSKLKSYALTGINQKLVDIKILYVEVDSSVYFNSSQITNVDNLKTNVSNSLQSYSNSVDLSKFGGRFKYSKVLNVIDDVDRAITSNITRVRIRRNMRALVNQEAQYELCFGNRFHVNAGGLNIKSTGFKIINEPDIVYLTDIPNSDGRTGVLSIVKPIQETGENRVVIKSAGLVDYIKGEVILTTVLITDTVLADDIIEVQAFPESNDVVGLKDLYLEFDVSKSTINMIKDTISSGEKISGVGFKVTSSYSNGELTRG
ncbi:MAG: baseplate wedge protein [Chloroflexi bacterium]|nr:baseplate wedge protein [Chloroflexota bacterium]